MTTQPDIKGLFKESGQKTMTFEFGGQEWTVHYRSANWKVRHNAIENAWKAVKAMDENGNVKDDIQFDVAQYYEQMFLHCLIDINGVKITAPVLREFDEKVITNLLPTVPAPNLATDLTAGKKEPKPSTDEDQ